MIEQVIKEKRKNKGWTQLILAKQSGVPQPTISQIERGERISPSYQSIIKIAKALEITIEELEASCS
ncbi:TPA: helix-turn-helix transcriptional regulator [Bacillus cytotoxicus]|uniref:helix-turn-helix domain-containing protein n=1 Tax=Bacillus cereus group TaxID=86661 RepID=UPI001D1464E3|nr:MULTISPECIES: helix-turn-helix transcriptional regulator [Bacillus cereus group]MCC2358459.1 helix-turn-helix domain-containing protein [Bacillus paranthracis]MCC3689074.1 helix-turn-helix domain-containing protein [Bacillus cereus]HDR4587794.1 helix-turn-helix transcriptional regulator [Bacillus cytotoxicus]